MESFRELFANVFGDSQGRTMLWWIADQCGYFATDPGKISPELLSFFNRLLSMGGVISSDKAGVLMDALVQVAKSGNENMEEDDDEIEP